LTITQINLFSEKDDPVIMPDHHLSLYQKFKIRNRYRKRTGKNNCGNCGNGELLEGNTKNYRKCKRIGFSSSTATDVSRNYVCDLHKPQEPK